MIDFFVELQKSWNIDLMIFLIVMLSGFFQEKYLPHWKLVKDERLCAALKTLFVSFLASTIYIFIVYKEAKGQANATGAAVLLPWGKYFITYFAATSIYDLLIRPFRKWITKVTGDNQSPKP